MKRSISFIIVTLVYIVAFLAGYFTFKYLKMDSHIGKIIIADVVATIVVWLFGVLFKNSSVYDPYWSVAPMVIVVFFVDKLDLKAMLMLCAIFAWGIRLTLNWAYTFNGLKYQDWRYTFYKNRFPRIWPLVNFFGINMFPTVVVIFALIPSYLYFQSANDINFFTYLGLLICLCSALLQLVADTQMHQFRKTNSGQVNTTGLWKYSRHPNYLGEIAMWWGVFFMMLSVAPNNLWYFFCPLINMLMFIFISIPLMEKRQLQNKPDYYEYRARTSMLLLLPSKNVSFEEEPS